MPVAGEDSVLHKAPLSRREEQEAVVWSYGVWSGTDR
jgi:hypothetical protein